VRWCLLRYASVNIIDVKLSAFIVGIELHVLVSFKEVSCLECYCVQRVAGVGDNVLCELAFLPRDAAMLARSWES